MTNRTQAMTASEPESFDITWRNGAYYVSVPNYQGGTVYTSEHIASLKARISELEANEKAYEEIIGKKTFQEVADRIRELEELGQFLVDRLEEFDPGDDQPEREFHGHVAPAAARLRFALQLKATSP